jgi:hypothetical protein
MKKILIGIVILFLLSASSVYIFIPAKLTVSGSISFNANREGVYRFLSNENNWEKWWPGIVSTNSDGSHLFTYKEHSFKFNKVLYNFIELNFTSNNYSSGSLLKAIPFGIDSIGIELSTQLITGVDPFSRISAYFKARKIKKGFDDILAALEKYTGDLKNIYGIRVKKEKVQYQYLVSVKQSFSHYPAPAEIYAIVEKLRHYIKRSGGQELFFPMLNISTIDSSNYIAQVGLPIDKKLPEEGDISVKWMMKDGNILTADVTGTPTQIKEATKQVERYITDYQRTIIAIPFQMLITDRTKEPDSTKWVTRIYYPVV